MVKFEHVIVFEVLEVFDVFVLHESELLEKFNLRVDPAHGELDGSLTSLFRPAAFQVDPSFVEVLISKHLESYEASPEEVVSALVVNFSFEVFVENQNFDKVAWVLNFKHEFFFPYRV